MTSPLDLGDALKVAEIVTIIGTGIGLAYRVGAALAAFKALGEKHTEEIEHMGTTLDELVSAQREQIRNTARLDAAMNLIVELRKDVNGLRRGEGYVQRRSTLDGEYSK